MSTKLSNLDVSESSIQIETFESIKLPPIFMQSFSIKNNRVICSKCNFSCKPNANYILFHLTICKGSLIEENISTAFKFKCLICKFKTEKIDEWKCHLFKLKHIVNSFDSCANGCSYDCYSCNTYFYGFKNMILHHDCKPKKLSLLSDLMTYVYENFKIQQNRMLHYCEDCLHYSYDITELHIKKNCRYLNVSSTFVCYSCLITFYDSEEKSYFNHKISFEHMVIRCMYGDRTSQIMQSSAFWKLPLNITKYFIISPQLEQFGCIVCDEIKTSSYNSMYDHFMECISSKDISMIDKYTAISKINCTLCQYQHDTVDKDLYQCWVNHVISFEHLSKTIVQGDAYYLFSYYCYVTETIFFGTQNYIQELIWETNDDIDRLLFVSEVMADVYRCANMHLNYSVIYCCGLCLYYTNNKYCKHKNINSIPSFYCASCLVDFNVKADYHEHLLTSEHIILKYFKPNKIGELQVLQHSMESMKMCLSNLNERNGIQNMNCSDHSYNLSTRSKNKIFCVPSVIIEYNDNRITTKNRSNELNSLLASKKNPVIENEQQYLKNNDLSIQLCSKLLSKQNFIATYDPKSNTVSNCIAKLHAQPNKSVFNTYLTMKFELLNIIPNVYNIFNESKSFVCVICDEIFFDQPSWTKHDADFHTNIKNPLVFYCAICHIFFVSTFIDIDNHIIDIEHKVMIDFQGYMDDNLNKSKTENITKSSLINDLKQQSVDKQDIIPQNIKKNKNIYVEIKDINKKLKTNNYYLLYQLIKDKYGQFKQISNQSNSCIIFFEHVKQTETFLNDKNKLENQYNFKIILLTEEKEENVLSAEIVDFFSDCKKLFNQLEIMKSSMDSFKMETKINKLCDSILNLYAGSKSINAHVFGSQIYGLASENSDVDLYLDIDSTFNGRIANNINLQIYYVKSFAYKCTSNSGEFKNIEEICDARVPILKFYHIPTKLNCDVSFKSGISLMNTKLIKSYLSMDAIVKWLVCAIVKLWAPKNGLVDKSYFTSYALVWLMLFYLMTKNIVPTLAQLVKCATKNDHTIIEGWDCTFGKWSHNINSQNRIKLLKGFFKYYAVKRTLKDNVLCIFTGTLINKNRFGIDFLKKSGINQLQRKQFLMFRSKILSDFEKCYGLTVQDPFDLVFNITKKISGQNLTVFCDLCDQSAKLISTKE